MWIEFYYKQYTRYTYMHTYTYVRIAQRRGNVAYPIPRGRSTFYCLLQTLSPKGSRWVQLHTVSRWRWPGRSSAWGLSQPCRQSGEKEWRKNIIINMLYMVHNTETYILHCILHTCPNLASLLLSVASYIPKMNRRSPKERAMHKLKWTKLWSFRNKSFL